MNKTLFPCVISTNGVSDSILRTASGIFYANSEKQVCEFCKKYVLDIYGHSYFCFNGIFENKINFVAGYNAKEYWDYSWEIIPLIVT